MTPRWKNKTRASHGQKLILRYVPGVDVFILHQSINFKTFGKKQTNVLMSHIWCLISELGDETWWTSMTSKPVNSSNAGGLVNSWTRFCGSRVTGDIIELWDFIVVWDFTVVWWDFSGVRFDSEKGHMPQLGTPQVPFWAVRGPSTPAPQAVASSTADQFSSAPVVHRCSDHPLVIYHSYGKSQYFYNGKTHYKL